MHIVHTTLGRVSTLIVVFTAWIAAADERLSDNQASDGHVHISAARQDDRGTVVHTVDSIYQSSRTEIRVLLPDRLDLSMRYTVLFVLPVESGRQSRYGDGLFEVQRQNLHNKHRLICVAPTFSDLPWYADSPTKPQLRQETYFLKVVVPFVQRTYPASDKRLLLGFSKSGWGAWTLLLRHPDIFERAVAWDAPLMMERFGRYGNRDIFGTQANFENYRLSDLLPAQAEMLRERPRLILLGYGNFRTHHQEAHALLKELQIPHDYRDGPEREHTWHSGWVSEAVECLVRDATPNADARPTEVDLKR